MHSQLDPVEHSTLDPSCSQLDPVEHSTLDPSCSQPVEHSTLDHHVEPGKTLYSGSIM